MSFQPIDDLMTIRDFLRFASTQFARSEIYYGHGTDNVWDEAVQLVMRSLALPLENNAIFLDARLTRDEKALLIDRIQRRVESREPVAYLLGEAWFMGLPFNVDTRVLVPRSPIGELIQSGLQPWLGDIEVNRILDLCTGSGCIGIAAATVFEEADVDLSDIPDPALEVAQSNIVMHGLEDRVSAIQSDLFAGL